MKKEVNLKGVEECPGFKVYNRNCKPIDWLQNRKMIPLKTCDSLYFGFTPIDTNDLGTYIKEMRFAINKLEQYQYFIFESRIFEDFFSKEIDKVPIIYVKRKKQE